MNGVSVTRLWTLRAVFLGVGFLVVAWRILPFDLTAGRIPWPDIFYCIAMAYIVRRPELAPLWAILLAFFLRDILTMSPLGLFTLLVVMGTEVVRANLQAFREYPFGLEWLWVTGIFALITVTQQLVLGLMLAQPPRFVDQVILVVLTGLVYPVVVFILKFGFGFDRPQPGETDGFGNRI